MLPETSWKTSHKYIQYTTGVGFTQRNKEVNKNLSSLSVVLLITYRFICNCQKMRKAEIQWLCSITELPC